MPYITYEAKTFRRETQDVIDQANDILTEYARQGFDLTLRQLYYQFVARDLIPNNDRSYKRLGSIVNDARLAGEIDWNRIVDRTRFLRSENYWDSPASIIRAAARGFQLDKWETQPTYVEVWVEKDALIGVIERACDPLETAHLSCRGYVSQSEMWRASQRFGERLNNGQSVVVFHLGDHDPSGIDMSRDIRERISDFLVGDGHAGWDSDYFRVERLALNFDQVEQYGPPPNPAKLSDSRGLSYVAEYGADSWELDALEPAVIVGLITDAVEGIREHEAWDEIKAEQDEQIKVLEACHERWAEVSEFLA